MSGAVVLLGDEGANSFTGGAANDRLYGRGGNDTLIGLAGDDLLDGGSGDDRLEGGDGNDTLFAGPGAHTMLGGAGEDILLAQLAAGGGRLDLQGGAGNDFARIHLIGAAFAFDLSAGGGPLALAEVEVVEIHGTAGADSLVGTETANIQFIGGEGADTLVDGGFFGGLYGGDGDDVLIAGRYQTNIDGGAGNDVLIGGPGHDTLEGASGSDTLDGGPGADAMDGGPGDDLYFVDDIFDSAGLFDPDGADTLISSVDQILNFRSIELLVLTGMNLRGSGTSAANTIIGGDGADTLDGGGSGDLLDGGAGEDLAVYPLAMSRYVVTRRGNVIEVSGPDGTGLLVGWEAAYGPVGTDTLIGVEWLSFGGARIAASSLPDLDPPRLFTGQADAVAFGLLDAAQLAAIAADPASIYDALGGNDTVTLPSPAFQGATETFLLPPGSPGAPDGVAFDHGRVFMAGAGNDTILGDAAADRADGGAGNDTLEGRDAADTLDGGDGNDSLRGDNGDDLLRGGAHADTLYGGGGNDTLDGGPGNDVLVAGSGADSLAGGEGADTVLGDFSGSSADIRLDIRTQPWLIRIGNAPATSIVGAAHLDIRFGDGNDTFFGDAGVNSMDGRGGDDSLFGLGGADLLAGGEDNDTLCGGAGNDSLRGDAGDDSLCGEGGHDTLAGGAGANTVDGGAGDDRILFGGGADTIEGGTGFDTLLADLSADTSGTFSDLTAQPSILIGGGGAATVTGVEFFELTLGSGNDTVLGASGGNTLDGRAGLDRLVGGAAADILAGGEGADTLFGGGGADRLSGDAGPDRLFGEAGSDTLIGGAGDDVADGGEGDDLLVLGPGADSLQGGSGADTVSFDFGTDLGGILGDFSGATDRIIGGGGAATLAGIEVYVGRLGGGADTWLGGPAAAFDSVDGAGGDDSLSGGALADTLLGGVGADTLHGGAGHDSLDGGAGFDVARFAGPRAAYVLDAAAGRVRVIGPDGADTLDGVELLVFDDLIALFNAATGGFSMSGSSGADTIPGTPGADTLDGLGGADSLLGFAGNDLLIGGAGADTLDGGAGADTMEGGADSDLFFVDDPGDLVTELPGGGNADQVRSSISYALPAEVERLLLLNQAGDADGTGNALANLITGNGGANRLTGGEGADTLRGLAGADTLDGGLGADSLEGGDGTDVAVFAGTRAQYEVAAIAGGWRITGLGARATDGADTVTGVEFFRFSDVLLPEADLLAPPPPPPGVLQGISVPVGADLYSNNVVTNTWAVTFPPEMPESTLGPAWLVNLHADIQVLPGFPHFGRAVGIGVPGSYTPPPATSVTTFTYTAPVVFDRIMILEHTHGVTQITLRVGDTPETLTSLGPITGSLGPVQGVLALQEFSLNRFDLPTGTSGRILEVTFSGANHPDGAAAIYRLLPILAGTEPARIIGTAAGDSLPGTWMADTMTGGDGADTLRGARGDDLIEGGEGMDSAIFTGARADYAINRLADGSLVIRDTRTAPTSTAIDPNTVFTPPDGADTLRGVESFVFTDGARSEAELGPLAPLVTEMADSVIGTPEADMLDGLGGNDTILGLEGNDSLLGSAGDDSIMGGSGANTLRGGTGADTLVSLSSADSLDGGEGEDLVIWDVSASTTGEFIWRYGDAEAARILGGSGPDTLYGSVGGDTLVGNAGADSLQGFIGDDTLDGGAANDTLVGDGGADTLRGGAGNDSLDGGADNDMAVFTGPRGNYGIEAFGAEGLFVADTVGGEGADTIVGVERFNFGGTILTRAEALVPPVSTVPTPGADSLTGTAGPNSLDGLGGNDTIAGLGGDDSLDGNAGADSLSGGADNDFLVDHGSTLNTEADTLLGGAGDDTLVSNGGADVLDGGPGRDLAVVALIGPATPMVFLPVNSVTQTPTGLGGYVVNAEFFDLHGGSGSDTLRGLGEGDHLSGFGSADLLQGMGGADTLYGDHRPGHAPVTGGADTLEGGAGNDSLDGGEGDDLAAFAGARDQFSIAAFGAEGLFVTDTVGGEGADTIVGVERFSFAGAIFTRAELLAPPPQAPSPGPDSLVGGDAAESINGLAGNDTILGMGGADTLEGGAGNDSLDGGAGSDLARYSGTWRDYDITEIGADLATRLVDRRPGAPDGTDTTIRIETFRFADGDRSAFEVANGPDVSLGELLNASPAWITYGYGGADSITGTAGNERLDGGEGGDSLSGAGGADTLIGDAGADTLDGGAGADSLLGGADSDTYIVDDPGDLVIETADGGNADIVRSFVSYTLPEHVERLFLQPSAAINGTGNGLANVVNGNNSANGLAGLAGNDTLRGLNGADTLEGGAGNDLIEGGDGADVAVFGGNYGQYTIAAIAGGFTLAGPDGADTVTDVESFRFADQTRTNLNLLGAAAGPGADTLAGDAGANSLDGLGGNDLIAGAGGNDTLLGNAGDDLLRGEAGDDDLRGGPGADTLEGGAGDDTLEGGAGNDLADYAASPAAVVVDLLIGYAQDGHGGFDALAGIEILRGSAFADLLIGGAGNETFRASAGADTIEGGEGFDVVDFTGRVAALYAEIESGVATGGIEFSGIEGLVGGAGADVLIGDAGANLLAGGAGNDVLTGGGGNDTLDGGTGEDTMSGGAGSDVYIVDSAGDVVMEGATPGTDWVWTTLAAYTLGARMESLAFIGSGSFAGTGNVGRNEIVGGAGADTLSGLGGSDILRGGGGRDILIGGEGVDRFVFDAASLGPAASHSVTIQDLDRALKERIDLVAVDAVAGTAEDDAFAFIGTAAFTGVAGQLRWTDLGAQRRIEGDVNGDGIADLTILTTAAGPVTAAWFLL